MANSSGNHHGHPSSFSAAKNQSNGNSMAQAERWSVILKHNPGICSEWTPEEQATLEDGLQLYASDRTLTRYAKTAMRLDNKTVRDVALRCRWMTTKENNKRNKEELSRKNKDKKERVIDPSAKPAYFAAPADVLPYASATIPVGYDGISYKAIGGILGEILEKNEQNFNQISANLASFKIQENISLLCQTRDNILQISNNLDNMPAIMMRQMPPLAVSVNEELANTVLLPPNIQRHS